MNHFAPIEKACIKVGGLTALARALGVASSTVYQWLVGARPVPPKRCIAIEHVTGGEVSRKDLRPNDWREIWPELAQHECVKRPPEPQAESSTDDAQPPAGAEPRQDGT